MKNKSVKLPFVTKNSKHLVGRCVSSKLNLLPCEKQKCQITLCNYKIKMSLYLHATRTEQSLPVPIVNVRTLSNQNNPISSKTFPSKN